MPALNGNYIDLIIVIVLALYIANGVQRGFWALAGDLVSFIGSLFIAFRTYGLVAKFLIANFILSTPSILVDFNLNFFLNKASSGLILSLTAFLTARKISSLPP